MAGATAVVLPRAGSAPNVGSSSRAHVDRAEPLDVVARLELHRLALAQRVEAIGEDCRAMKEALAAGAVDEKSEAAVARQLANFAGRLPTPRGTSCGGRHFARSWTAPRIDDGTTPLAIGIPEFAVGLIAGSVARVPVPTLALRIPGLAVGPRRSRGS
jgi:hypothetical protein